MKRLGASLSFLVPLSLREPLWPAGMGTGMGMGMGLKPLDSVVHS